jgi:hypothetical protein
LGVNQSGESKFSLDISLALLTFVNSFAELLRVLIVEEERETGDVLDGAGVTNEHFELFHVVVVVDNLDRAPVILTLFVAGRDTVELARMLGTMFEPLFWGAVKFPSVIAGKCFGWRHIGLVENFVLFFKNGERLFGGLVLVEIVFGLRQEGGLLHDEVVFLDDVGVASGQSLKKSC